MNDKKITSEFVKRKKTEDRAKNQKDKTRDRKIVGKTEKEWIYT